MLRRFIRVSAVRGVLRFVLPVFNAPFSVQRSYWPRAFSGSYCPHSPEWCRGRYCFSVGPRGAGPACNAAYWSLSHPVLRSCRSSQHSGEPAFTDGQGYPPATFEEMAQAGRMHRCIRVRDAFMPGRSPVARPKNTNGPLAEAVVLVAVG